MNEYDYDDNRPPRRLLIGAAALAAVLLLLLGTAIGRASAPSSGPTSSATSATPQAGPGPARMVNGVPVGYAHTEAGAVAAATNFLMVVDGPLITQPDRYRSAIDTLSAPEARAKQRSDAESALHELDNLVSAARQGRAVVFRTTPLAYRVERFNSSSARVSVWTEGLVAIDGVLSMRVTWATIPLTVEWTGGDWKLSSIAPSAQESPGPVPVSIQPAGFDAAFPPQLANYRSYQQYVGS